MSWFKKIFQNYAPETKAKIKVYKEIKKEETPEYTSSTSFNSYFSGLDNDFINFIYFKDEKEKEKFISEIEKVLSKLKINKQTDVVSGTKKVAEETIPFLNEIISYNLQTVTTIIEEKGKEATVRTVNTILDTHDKLENYYIALKLCSHNLEKKIENRFYDFKFEEDLINKTLKKSDLFNFARISTLFGLGTSFYKANQIENMEKTFNKIRHENYQLSSSTVADYYRKIGEIYIELKQNGKALDWLKDGLTLKPKLGVKKLIDRLEKN
jgi:tetratricopeptide (TPR) repeat protein